jgi:alkylation response protein AidB-like acyl-CoA dehydrogenase
MSGASCDLAIVLVRTPPYGRSDMTLLAVPRGTRGFVAGRPLKKLGRRGQDTAELFFDGCRVPEANVVGPVGGGLRPVMANLRDGRPAQAGGMARRRSQ